MKLKKIAWEVVLQSEFVGHKKPRKSVPVKRLRFIPYNHLCPKTKELETRFFCLGHIMLKVSLKPRNVNSPCWFTYSSKTGKYVWHGPDKLEYPPIRDTETGRPLKYRGRLVRDELADPVLVKAPGTRYNPAQFEQFLNEKVGKELADEIFALMSARYDEIVGKQIKIAA